MEAVVQDIETKSREKLLIALYKNTFPIVAKYINKMGGSFDDARDIFQDALLVYYEKRLEMALHFRKDEKAYILGIAKYLWINRFREKSRSILLNEEQVSLFSEMEPEFGTSDHKILSILEQTSKKCMELLQLFYYQKLNMDQLAKSLGFSGVRSATVQKYKCLEKVRNKVKENSLTYEDFIE